MRGPSARGTLCALCFWAAALAGGLLAGALGLVMLLAGSLLGLLGISGGVDLEATEDLVLARACGSRVRHEWRAFSVGGRRCRGHALAVGHRGRATGAPTAVLLHGNAASALCFGELFDGLSEGFDVVAMDLPGFGRSEAVRPAGGEDMVGFLAGFVHAFMGELGVGEAFVVAHSFGACVASGLAVRWPGSVSHLLLLDGAGLLPTLGAAGACWAVLFRSSALQWHRCLGKAGARSFLGLCRACGLGEEACYWYAVTGCAGSWGGRAVAGCIGLAWHGAWWRGPTAGALAGLGVPIATGYGAADSIVPAHQVRAVCP